MIISEVMLGLVPIIFFISGMTFLVRHFQYITKGKEHVGKVIAIEKYISRSGTKNRSSQLMYRSIIEFYHQGEKFLFSSAGRNYINLKIGQSVTLLMLDNNPCLIRLKNSVHILFGVVFTAASLVVGYFMVYKNFEHINFLYSCVFAIVASISFYNFLKKKSKGKFTLSELFKTQLLSEESLKGRDLFRENSQIQLEDSKNAKVGLIITFCFIGFYSFIFNICYSKITNEQFDLMKKVFYNLDGFNQILEHSNKGPMVGFLFCLLLAPFLLHSLIYSLKKL